MSGHRNIRNLLKSHLMDLIELLTVTNQQNVEAAGTSLNDVFVVSDHVVNEIQKLLKQMETCDVKSDRNEGGNISSDSSYSMKSAMLNHIILRKVFSFMNATDLLKLRSACKKWTIIANETISTTKSMSVTLNETNVNRLNLADLNQVVGQSRKFPIDTLVLNLEVWDAKNEEVSLFIDIHGPFIKTIVIHDCRGLNETKKFIKLLTSQCKNVEHLIMNTIYYNVFRDWAEERTPFWVPSLQTLDFTEYKCRSFGILSHTTSLVLYDLIRSATNLKTVEGNTVDILQAVQQFNKKEAVQNFCISGSDTTSIQALRNIHPELKHLTVHRLLSTWSQSFVHYLKLVIESSKESLQSLEIYAFYVMTKTGITTLPNLKKLYLFYPSENAGWENAELKKESIKPIFPERTILAKTFPALKTLAFQQLQFDKKSVWKYFPGENYQNPTNRGIDSLMTLRNLELIDCKCPQFGLKCLARKFPNVKSLKVGNVKNLFFEEDSIWFIPWADQLEILELRGFTCNELFLRRSLDSLFTGIPEKICSNLRHLMEAGEKDFVCDINVLQTHCSVRDLKNLKKLKIVFIDWKTLPTDKGDDGNSKTSVTTTAPVVTEVTNLYAFNLMPKLHGVIFSYDESKLNSEAMKAALKPMSDVVFVTVGSDRDCPLETTNEERV